MTPLQAIFIAVIEGITEFLPISSTGHMIIAQSALGIPSTNFTKAFLINIQFGAILSVLVLYWRKFLQSAIFYKKLFIAFLPAAVIGFALHDIIDRFLESVFLVGLMMLAGGIVLLYVDRWFLKPDADQTITGKKAFVIGLFQCVAMIPGVSRSAATIIGGMAQKLDRTTAAEFSFFLAVPTMFAASAYKLLETYPLITSDRLGVLLLGNAVAFLVAMAAIKGFIAYLTSHGFRIFGWYRIALGLAILALYALGYELRLG